MGSIISAALADIDASSDDVSVLFILLALLCLGGAAYLAYLRNVLGAALLVFVAIVALLFGA